MNKIIKLKEPSVVRTYDADGFRKRAACVCVNHDESKVLLVTSRKDLSQWIVPGGGVEPDEAEETAAVREVREEAGVCGNLGRCLGIFENGERGHRTSVYVLAVTEELDDWDESRTYGRQRQWFTVEAAVGALHKPLQSNYVKLLLPSNHHCHTQPPHRHIPPTHLKSGTCSTQVSTESSSVQPSTDSCSIQSSTEHSQNLILLEDSSSNGCRSLVGNSRSLVQDVVISNEDLTGREISNIRSPVCGVDCEDLDKRGILEGRFPIEVSPTLHSNSVLSFSRPPDHSPTSADCKLVAGGSPVAAAAISFG